MGYKDLLLRKESSKASNLNSASTPAIFNGTKLGHDDDSQSLLVCSSFRPKERATSTNSTFYLKQKVSLGGFYLQFVSLGRSSSTSSMSKDKGLSSRRTESLVH